MAMPIGDPFIVLMERTLENLHIVHNLPNSVPEMDEEHEHKRSIFEVTQTINSFLSVLIMPWDRVFNKVKLNGETNNQVFLRKLGFPPFENSCQNDVRPNSLGAILESLRHGVAHGGVRILSLEEFKELCPSRPIPLIQIEHIAALEIESKSEVGRGPRSWGCALSVDELCQFLEAMVDLSRHEKYVLPDVWKTHQEALAEQRRIPEQIA